jgi:hypothetical protein
VASGVYKASSMIGGSIGVALATAVFQGVASSRLADDIATSPSVFAGQTETGLLDVLTGSKSAAGLSSQVMDAVDSAFEAAAGEAMFVGAAAALVGLLLALVLLRGRGGEVSPD